MNEAKNEYSGEATTSNDKLGVKQPVAWRVTPDTKKIRRS